MYKVGLPLYSKPTMVTSMNYLSRMQWTHRMRKKPRYRVNGVMKHLGKYLIWKRLNEIN